MTGSTAMVEVVRGPFVESLHRGHAVVCDAEGNSLMEWGDPDAVILPRSSCKMLQALPLVESGAAAELNEEQLALACASHAGAAIHVERVEAWLRDLGYGERDLLCGVQVPEDRSERVRLRAEREEPCQVHNTCSGKHVGFLTFGKHIKADMDYVEPDNAVQKAVKTVFEEMTGVDSAGYGVDGCSAPSFATTTRGLALAMARMADPSRLGATRAGAARRLVSAMTTHPLLVSGEGRVCSELMAAAKGRAAVKFGADALFTAILPERGLGVALKIEDGGMRGAECAIATILARLGVVSTENPFVKRWMNPEIRSKTGRLAGEIRPAAALWGNGALL